jgi:transcription elongation factor Elf1
MSNQPVDLGALAGGVAIDRKVVRPGEQPLPAIPPAVYCNDVGATATDLDITWDFAFMHTGLNTRQVQARVAMSWEMFDQFVNYIGQIAKSRHEMKQQLAQMEAAEKGDPRKAKIEGL